MWENDSLRKHRSDIVYVGDFSRTEDLSNTCRKTTYMGKTDKRFRCTMNYRKCPGKCGCIMRSGGKSIGLQVLLSCSMCLSIWNASKRLLLATGILYFIKISISWYTGEYCIRIIYLTCVFPSCLLWLGFFLPPKLCHRLLNQIPSHSLLI